MSTLYTESVTAARAGGAGSWVDGIYVPAATANIPVICSIQPLRGNETQQLPEGRRSIEHMKLYTATKLRAADEKAKTPADIISYDGKTWEVMEVQNWYQTSGLQHYKCVIMKRDYQGGGTSP